MYHEQQNMSQEVETQLMEEILHPLIGMVVYPIIYKVLHIHTVVVWDFFHQTYEDSPWKGLTNAMNSSPSRPLKSRKKVEISMRPGALPVSKLSLLGDMKNKICWKLHGKRTAGF